MASPTLTVGDTFPAIRGAASDEDGLMELAKADAIEFLAVSAGNAFGGAAEVIDPPEDVGDSASNAGFNWRYTLDGEDTATPGTYVPWLKVTWNSEADPPEVEWVKGGDKLTIQAAPK